MSEPIRLNLGCGANRIEGWLNVDCLGPPVCNPDVVWDLNVTPWRIGEQATARYHRPLEDSSVTEITLNHVLEHLGATPALFIMIMKEMYRVCEHQALIRIAVPCIRHDDFWGDPTHVRPVTPQIMELFSLRKNKEWREMGAANSCLAMAHGVDFDLESVEQVLDPRFDHLKDKPDIAVMAETSWNVIKEIRMVLRSVKE
jgi:hypothetical protein